MTEFGQQYGIPLIGLALFILNGCDCNHRPGPTVDKMVRPSSILRHDLSDGRVKFTVTNVVFNKSPEDDWSLGCFRAVLPKTADICFDTTNGLIHVTGRLSLADIKKAIDHENWTGAGCSIPFWDELVLQDRRSEEFASSLYSLVFMSKIEFPDTSVAYLCTKRDKPDTLLVTLSDRRGSIVDYQLQYTNGKYRIGPLSDKKPIEYEKAKKMLMPANYTLQLRVQGKTTATAVFTPHSYSCHRHLRYALRVYDSSSDEYVWENTTDIACDIAPIANDFDNDGTDEIVIFQIDHEVSVRVMVFKRCAGPSRSHS